MGIQDWKKKDIKNACSNKGATLFLSFILEKKSSKVSMIFFIFYFFDI